MTTSELIELLQKKDPSGKCHVRVNGMMPIDVERKEGYWDGPYQYFDDGKLVFSTMDEKVDIYTLDVETWIWENYEDWENKVKFNFNYIHSQEKIDEIKANLTKSAHEAAEFDKESIKEFSEFVINKIKNGYKVIQEDTNLGRYNTMFFTKPDEKIQLRQGDCHAIIRGSFKPIIKKDYIEWEPE
ncbi:MAG: hypothetical protein ACOC3V_04705 [bacterium]